MFSFGHCGPSHVSTFVCTNNLPWKSTYPSQNPIPLLINPFGVSEINERMLTRTCIILPTYSMLDRLTESVLIPPLICTPPPICLLQRMNANRNCKDLIFQQLDIATSIRSCALFHSWPFALSQLPHLFYWWCIVSTQHYTRAIVAFLHSVVVKLIAIMIDQRLSTYPSSYLEVNL